MTKREYDVIVIGAGPVGENVADRARAGGLSVAIIESELVGGECSYWACIPSKALLRPGVALNAARAVAGANAAITGSLDVAAVLTRRDDFAENWDDSGQLTWLAKKEIDLVRGHGRLSGVRSVVVEKSSEQSSAQANTTEDDGSTTVVELHARQAVVVCTGTDASIPDIAGLAAAMPWTSREATSATNVPASLAIIGGGVVACEMATVYRSLGPEVTIIARSGLLGHVEAFASDAVTTSLRESGVTIVAGSTPTAVRRLDSDAGVVLEFADRDAITASEVLVATGRSPRTRDIGLDAVGLEPGSWLSVDDTMRVTEASDALDGGWLYAVGDVNHRALLTHQGKYQARAAGDVIVARAHNTPIDDKPWGVHVATADHSAVPQVIFTDPEVAAVGLSTVDEQVRERVASGGIRVIEYNLGWVAGAGLHRDGYSGHVSALIDVEREVLLGMTLVGADVSEMLHAATIAITGEVPLSRLWHAVPAFPTMSEVWLRLLEEYGRPQVL